MRLAIRFMIVGMFGLLSMYTMSTTIPYFRSDLFLATILICTALGVILRDVFDYFELVTAGRKRNGHISRLIDPDHPRWEYYSGNKEVLALKHWERSEKERIIGSTIVHPSGVIFVGLAPTRHFDVIRIMDHQGMAGMENTSEQGFLTNRGRHVNRFEAYVIATRNQQLLKVSKTPGELYSEDVWDRPTD